MPSHQQLQRKIRRSSSFSPLQIYQDYMQYAKQCRDQIQVYYYMQQNHIGSNQPLFWLELLKCLQQQCQLKEIVKKLTMIKKNTQLKQKDNFVKILQYQQYLCMELEMMIRTRRGRKRRSHRELELFSIDRIQKKQRKIGGIEIYVDEDCRQTYQLEDFSQFILQNMKQQLQYKKNQYLRRQLSKPLSFLGVNKQNIEKWSLQLIQNNNNGDKISGLKKNIMMDNYNSHNKNNSNRFSISRKSNLINPENCYATPKVNNIKINEKMEGYENHGNKDLNINRNSVGNMIGDTDNNNNQNSVNNKFIYCNAKIPHKQRVSINQQFPQLSPTPIKKNQEQRDIQLLKSYKKSTKKSIDYSFCKQDIRAIKQQIKNEYIEIIDIQNQQKQDKRSFMDLQTADIGFIECDERFNMKAVINCRMDEELREIIKMTQLETLESHPQKKQTDSIQQYSQVSMYCEQQQLTQKLQYQSQLIESSLNDQKQQLPCSILGGAGIKSTQTLESIDSNQQNLLTVTKNSHQQLHLKKINPFLRQDRKVFRILTQQDLLMMQIMISDDSQLDIKNIENNNQNDDITSIDGDNYMRQMIHDIDYCMNQKNEQTQGQIQLNNNSNNIVLETLRKKKLGQILSGQDSNYLSQHYANSQRSSLNKLNLSRISEQKSYNSQRKYCSRQRWGSSGLNWIKQADNNQNSNSS